MAKSDKNSAEQKVKKPSLALYHQGFTRFKFCLSPSSLALATVSKVVQLKWPWATICEIKICEIRRVKALGLLDTTEKNILNILRFCCTSAVKYVILIYEVEGSKKPATENKFKYFAFSLYKCNKVWYNNKWRLRKSTNSLKEKKLWSKLILN